MQEEVKACSVSSTLCTTFSFKRRLFNIRHNELIDYQQADSGTSLPRCLHDKDEFGGEKSFSSQPLHSASCTVKSVYSLKRKWYSHTETAAHQNL